MKEFLFALIAIALLIGVTANFFNKDIGQHMIAKFMSMFHADTVQEEQDNSGKRKKQLEDELQDQNEHTLQAAEALDAGGQKEQASSSAQQVKSDEERARERSQIQQEEMRRRMDSLKDKMGR
jgi:hypothetical protein